MEKNSSAEDQTQDSTQPHLITDVEEHDPEGIEATQNLNELKQDLSTTTGYSTKSTSTSACKDDALSALLVLLGDMGVTKMRGGRKDLHHQLMRLRSSSDSRLVG